MVLLRLMNFIIISFVQRMALSYYDLPHLYVFEVLLMSFVFLDGRRYKCGTVCAPVSYNEKYPLFKRLYEYMRSKLPPSNDDILLDRLRL
jgi:hypothetical protein